jgi:hypothetical protein
MRKFKKFRRHASPLRLLFFFAAAFALLAAFTPTANAALIRYYNFEGTDTAPYPVNLESNLPAVEVGLGFRAFLNTGPDPTMAATGAYPTGNTSQEAGLPLNVAAGDPAPNLTSLGIHRSGQARLFIDIPMLSALGVYDVTSVSFAANANGNGFQIASLLVSFNGGTTFTQIGASQAISGGTGSVLTFAIPAGTTVNQPSLVLRIAFTGGQSNGNDLQNQIDNIQINGTIIPEPATVASGLLGVLGLCWHQRKRLISSVRFRCT